LESRSKCFSGTGHVDAKLRPLHLKHRGGRVPPHVLRVRAWALLPHFLLSVAGHTGKWLSCKARLHLVQLVLVESFGRTASVTDLPLSGLVSPFQLLQLLKGHIRRLAGGKSLGRALHVDFVRGPGRREHGEDPSLVQLCANSDKRFMMLVVQADGGLEERAQSLCV